ncbi:MAG: SUKH-4 family immunity protein [Acidobacteria bacterium]|nr:SUKH-4 family immunity protein [Acidobacteriota bacterium]
MTPQEFKTRYLKGLSDGFKGAPDEVKAELEQRFSEFITFPSEMIEKSMLSQKDQNFLSGVGLPKSAAPALNFLNLYELQPDFESRSFFKNYFLIGTGGGERLLAIEKESGAVVCFDLSSEKVSSILVNDSLEKFAECLCLFQEYRDRNELDICFEAMCGVDSMLTEYENFWEAETENFFDNVLESLNEAARKSNQ